MSTYSCPICESLDCKRVLDRSFSPALQNAVYACEETAINAGSAPLAMTACERCGFVWNAKFDPAAIDYNQNYNNSQDRSDVFKAHVRERIERIKQTAPEGKLEILEVGCGQGDFLAALVEAFGTHRVHRAVGFDPAYKGVSKSEKIKVFPDYFDRNTSLALNINPDIVVSRHTIEHVPHPIDFLKAIRSAIPDDKAIKIYLETPTNDWIVRNGAVHDFFYEHCSLFTLGSISLALERAAFIPTAVESCFQDQYIWAEGTAARPLERINFRSLEAAYKQFWQSRAEELCLKGEIFIWGAGAKGATFASIIDSERTRFTGVVDINPAKQGRFIGGTGHPIVSVKDLLKRPPVAVFIMNPNYEVEIRQTLSQHGLAPEIITVK